MSSTIVRGVCPHDCPDTCALLVTVEDGKAVAVKGDPDHPTTAGVLCTKVSRYTERTYHPERLLYPQKRVGKKGAGQFVRISWEEALSTIAARLAPLAAERPLAILPYSYAGTMGLLQGDGMAQRFFHRIGASFLDRTICATAGGVGYKYTLGARVGTDTEQVQNARLIIIWGGNPIASNLHLWMRVQEAKREGAQLICIDPYRSLTAEKCHQHIALLPGTDAALALGMMHVLCAEDLLDHAYIAAHTLGFAELKQRVAEWDPERVAAVCGITAAEVIGLARAYGQAGQRGEPSLIRMNYGIQRVHGGGMAVRNIACLPALTGAWRHAAGGVQLSLSDSFPRNTAYLQRPDLFPAELPRRTINMSTIGDDLLRPSSAEFGPQIEALFVYNSNPVAIAPESGKVMQGFAREDLFTVVLEHFQTDTADYADLLLPATTQLEHTDIHSTYGHLYMMANNAAIAPLGEAKPNSEIFRLLAQAMGYTEPCFSESDDEMASRAFNNKDERAIHFDWASLKKTGWQKLRVKAAPFAEGGFTTPSGKCEFYSATMARDGFDPLPGYTAPHESVASAPQLAQHYPLAMISPPARNFLNSTFVNVKSLRDTEGEPHLDMHPDDATARAIADGDMLRIFNDRGSFVARARVTDKARAGLVVALSIWWKKLASDHKNANEVVSQGLTDMGKGPTFYDVLVQVERLNELP
ncbi:MULTISPECIES: molybdopterin oxidoreductase family protein [unclassified Undibacterium]|uniref:molybdopterin-containing oxidoreductase family protein n=1 Tax=unclassified Undibacterium TaxID=2630295 RepID=UPI002AC96A6A|nr:MULTISPECIES: molybdopterin oxidoreductase family protein [unclassified Undibacterium]MEB0138278.1 molybdopterin oxidoreductase family protein [Undibacterium sp. CCC2.1]MEB0171561.1 molybdopterin oxidoreductase family protein [Undibacterium sp. CCC1.1]MEB0175519.1 molybdopterin oxidoreductase family protein [Undibacterium sp. CCC3.4]MEB0214761.1 molybdopterin oxidoreductase family protein [Undibacterium sp. 5I2]WPX45248.1 molybdopterin oxidoreductase family protein [Undibacterium sp. CCC3.4